MINLIYDPINGQVVPDGKINEWADNLQDGDVIVGAETMVHELRARHAEGKLEIAELITFRRDGSDVPGDWFQMSICPAGGIDHWPRGFCDFTMDALYRLLQARDK